MKLKYFVVLLIFLASCSTIDTEPSVTDFTTFVNDLPEVHKQHIIVLGDDYKYNFGGHNADTLTLTKTDEGFEQSRKITFIMPQKDITLSFPKSFASTTDDLSVVSTQDNSELDFEVIEYDPKIKVEDITYVPGINIISAVKLVNEGGDIITLVQKEARRHQFFNLLDQIGTDSERDLRLLALMTKYPNEFNSLIDTCDVFEIKEYQEICVSVGFNSPDECDTATFKHLCRQAHFEVLKSKAKGLDNKTLSDDEIQNLREKAGVDKYKPKTPGECYDDEDCPDDYACSNYYCERIRPEKPVEVEEKNKPKMNDFDMEQEYDYYFMFENPEDGCEQINLGYEITDAIYVTRKDLLCKFRQENTIAQVTIHPFRTGKAALDSWQKWTNPDNPEEYRKEHYDTSDNNKWYIEELYKNVKIKADGDKSQLELNGLIDNAKDYVDSILPQYEK